MNFIATLIIGIIVFLIAYLLGPPKSSWCVRHEYGDWQYENGWHFRQCKNCGYIDEYYND